MFDCIIIGAGPSGGSAAYHLSKRGRSVLLLEAESLPRYKPCGGGVSPAVAEWFDFDFSPVISLRINQIRVTWKLEDPVVADLNGLEPVWMVRRDVFDHYLVQQAQKQGAELRDSTPATGIQFQGDHWQVNTASGPLTGKYLIACDGAKGPTAKWLRFKERRQRLAGTLEAPAPAQGNNPAQFEFGLVKNGYLWSFPKADGSSISISTFIGGDRQDLNTTAAEYIKASGINPQSVKHHTHPLCLWEGNQALHTQNALLAGEAASLVDPFTGEGVRPALFTGMLAAEAIDQALGGDAGALEAYSRRISEEWGTDLQWAQRIAGLFYRFPSLGYKVGVKRPAATKIMAQILCGKLRYGEVAGRAIKRLGSGMIPGMG